MDYKNPAVAADIVPVRYRDGVLEVGLMTRVFAPEVGRLALPGVLLEENETIAEGLDRAAEKGDIAISGAVPLPYRDNPGRDQRFRVLGLPHLVVADSSVDGSLFWVSVDKVKDLAFDHESIVDDARVLVRHCLVQNKGFLQDLCGGEITVPDVRAIMNVVGGDTHPTSISRVLQREYVAVGKSSKGGQSGRPAVVYKVGEK